MVDAYIIIFVAWFLAVIIYMNIRIERLRTTMTSWKDKIHLDVAYETSAMQREMERRLRGIDDHIDADDVMEAYRLAEDAHYEAFSTSEELRTLKTAIERKFAKIQDALSKLVVQSTNEEESEDA